MDFTIQDCIASANALTKLGEGKYGIKASIQIAKNQRAFGDVAKVFEDRRVELLQKYGTENDDGTFKVDEKNIKAFNEDIGKLLKEEVPVDVVHLTEDDLEGAEVSPNVLVPLEWLFVAPKKAPAKKRARRR